MEPFIRDGDTIQIMGISKVGFQGEQFDERAVDLVKHFRDKFPDAILSVDGGVNLESAPIIARAGATRLAVGSALFNTVDVADTLALFKKRLNDIHLGGENSGA